MIVLVGSQKGGVGKSTLAVNLSAEWARQGRDVVLVDCDFQRNAARWAQDREDAAVKPTITCVEARQKVSETLLKLDEKYDLVVVDVPGKDSIELRTAMTVADRLLMPAQPSQFDLDTIKHLSEVIEQAQIINPDLLAFGVLTRVSTNVHVAEDKDAAEYLADFPIIRPLRVEIHERKAFRDVLEHGLGVVEWDNPRAKAEIQLLAQELLAPASETVVA